MSLFVDTGLFYALQNTRAQHHEAAKNALAVTNRGRYGRPFTSEYVFDEIVTPVRSHRGYREAKVVGDRILGAGEYPAVYDLPYVGEHETPGALDVFERYNDHPLSFTDATTTALMDAQDIYSLLSFDTDFDGIVDRLDPSAVSRPTVTIILFRNGWAHRWRPSRPASPRRTRRSWPSSRRR